MTCLLQMGIVLALGRNLATKIDGMAERVFCSLKNGEFALYQPILAAGHDHSRRVQSTELESV